MTKCKSIRFASLFFSSILAVAASICLFSCNMDAEPYEFLKKYGDIATVKNVAFDYKNGYVIHMDDWENVSPMQYLGPTSNPSDLVVNYEIDNPGDFEISASLGVAGVENPDAEGIKISVNSNTSLSITYPAAFIDSRNMDYGGSGDISPKIFLTRVSDNYGQSYDTRAIRVNGPPPGLSNAISQILSGDDERMIICFILPENMPIDVNAFFIRDERTNTIHKFEYSNGAITVGTEDKGWKIDTVAPGTLEPTCPNGPVFDPTYYSGTPYYVTTDVKNILSLDIFELHLVLRDQAGLEAWNLVNSRVQMMDPLTCNIPETAYMLENTFEQPYIELTVNPPANVPDATLYLHVRDADDNVIADINGNTESCEGATTFHLYPEIDGQSKYYYVSIYASKSGWMGTGISRSLYISGKKLEDPVATPAPVAGATVAQDTEVTITSAQDGTITCLKSIGGGDVTGPSPVKVVLADLGENILLASVSKDYYKYSASVSFTYDVAMTKVYVKQGAPAGGSGTITNPFSTIQQAQTALDTSGASDPSGNTICVMGDLKDMTAAITVGASSDYYNIVGYDDNGLNVAPVELAMAVPGSVINLSTGTLALRAIKIVSVSNVSNGAVHISGGNLIIKDQVTILGNTKDSSGTPANICLDAGQKIKINQANLSGTRVGVTTATLPSAGTVITVTSGYKDSGVTDAPSVHFESDSPSCAFILDASGEAVLASGGGSISVGDIYSVAFAQTASAGVYTFTASATPTSGGSPVDITADCSWSMKLYYLNTDTGMSAATNTMDLSALSTGTYIMKISAVYGGKTYSGEVEITVSGP